MGYDTGEVKIRGTVNMALLSDVAHVEASSGMVILHTDRNELQQMQFTPKEAVKLSEALSLAASYYEID